MHRHEAVKLPEGEDRDEWVAVNTVDFFNQINMLCVHLHPLAINPLATR
jgi:hypothetical protein